MNRGNQKQLIFKDDKDRLRFLFLILYFQSPQTFPSLNRHIVQNPILNINNIGQKCFNVSDKDVADIIKNRYVELIAFELMPNHFHLLIREKIEGGISQYMHRVLISYTKYFNKKYDQSGHLFQGPYKARHQKDENHLFYTSAYIHSNARELKDWKRREHLYPWSSYPDYIGENRWGELLANDIIRGQFENGNEYKEYVEWTDIKGEVEEI